MAKDKEALPAIAKERLPYHPGIGERFGVDRSEWRALVEAVFPGAETVDAVILALSYCKARKLDPFKRVVHIVPIYNKQLRRMVDTIWPGIGELRTTAHRTACYAGRDETVFGPNVTQTWHVPKSDKFAAKDVTVTYPAWAQVTVYRMVGGVRVPFCGPRVYWLETYATVARGVDAPNEMWARRPSGMIEKCAEAAALRTAFPEELGDEHCSDEVGIFSDSHDEGRLVDSRRTAATVVEALTRSEPVETDGPTVLDLLADELRGADADLREDVLERAACLVDGGQITEADYAGLRSLT